MTRKTFERGGRLPALRLTPAGEPLVLRGRRGPLVLLGLDADRCAGCADYVRALGRGPDEIAGWGARVVVITGGSRHAHDVLAAAAAAHVVLATDPDGDFVTPSGPAARILIADEWGEIHFAANGAAVADLPAVAEIVEWVRFIAIQCPECEQPEGEWRAV